MNNKKIIALCFLIITLGLMWNFNLIRSNINEYSHESWNGELGYFSYYNETGKFPFDRDFDNYRYGGIRYSAKALNFFFLDKVRFQVIMTNKCFFQNKFTL